MTALRCSMLHSYLVLSSHVILMLLSRGLLHSSLLLGIHKLRACHQMRRQVCHLPARLHDCQLLRVEAGLARLLDPSAHLRLSHHMLSLGHQPLLVEVHDMRVHARLLHAGLGHHLPCVWCQMRHGVRTRPAWDAHSWLHAHHGRLRHLLSMWCRHSGVHVHRPSHGLRVRYSSGHRLAVGHAGMLRHTRLRRECGHHLGLRLLRPPL
jgi:hypothetical protein